MESYKVWCTSQSTDCILGQTTCNVLIIAIVLGKGFLNKGTPERMILWYACEKSCTASTRIPKGQIVIDNHCVRDSKRIQIDRVDAFWAQLILVVQEDFIDTVGDLCDSRASCKEPAVAQRSLTDIVRLDSILPKQGCIWELFTSTLPNELVLKFSEFLALAKVFPIQRGVVMNEFLVIKLIVRRAIV